MPEGFDVAVLGGGSGGYVAAIRAAQLGLRTALIERDKVGGTCLHRGCIPTKSLLQTAFLLDAARQGERLGVRTGDVALDFGAASRRKQEVVDQLHKGVEGLLRKNRVTVVAGSGRLEGRGRVAVTGAQGDGTTVEATSVILASGWRG